MVYAQATNGDEALSLCAHHAIDVVLMDMRMPVIDNNMAHNAFHNVTLKGNASDFDLSEREINSITQLLSKLDLKDRTQIVAFAFRNPLTK